MIFKLLILFIFSTTRVAPALLRQATYGSLKLGFYHALKRRLVKDPKGKSVPGCLSKNCCVIINGYDG